MHQDRNSYITIAPARLKEHSFFYVFLMAANVRFPNKQTLASTRVNGVLFPATKGSSGAPFKTMYTREQAAGLA